jgi:DinB family protein
MKEIIIPDATNEPGAYRDALITLLGERDPIEVLSSTHTTIVRATSGLSLEILRTPPRVGEWSTQELIGHLLDAEMAYAFRWRLTLTEEQPHYPAYNEKSWASLPKPPFPSVLEAFGVLCNMNLFLLQSLPASWQRVGIHAEQGPETVELTMRKLAGHDLAHLNQLERTLATVAASTDERSV